MATVDPTIAPAGADPLHNAFQMCNDLGVQLVELEAVASSLDTAVTSTGTTMTWEELNRLAGLASAQLRLAKLAKAAHGELMMAISGAGKGGAQ